MKRKYDSVIDEHYEKVAHEQGLSATSTMADEMTRQLETDAIVSFVEVMLAQRAAADITDPAVIMDVGCGNGYTVEVLSQHYAPHTFIGIEKSAELRGLAQSRFKNQANVTVAEGDIRDPGFAGNVPADILICQRVLINLLDSQDQALALGNLLDAVKAGGKLLFIEAFTSGLDKLNEARSEFDLPLLPPAHHNLYLPDDFFQKSGLKPMTIDRPVLQPNFLSTHYYVTRVLHPIFTEGKPFKRNSEFVRFFSLALNKNAGDYSPLRVYLFEKQ